MGHNVCTRLHRLTKKKEEPSDINGLLLLELLVSDVPETPKHYSLLPELMVASQT